jgi:hypothetical protein
MRRNTAPSRLGCFSLNGIAAAVLVVLFVAGISIVQGGILFNPGPLNAQSGVKQLGGVASHADIKSCSGCHPAPLSSQKMTDACLACHVDLKQDPKNFHNVMVAEGTSVGCVQCHSDHNGPAAVMLVKDLQNFPHNSTGFALTAHQKMASGATFKCSDCHLNGFVKFDQATCVICHNSLNNTFMTGHIVQYGETCLNCHDGVDTYGHAFDHTKVSFVLTGKHLTLTCDKCHAGARAIADFKAVKQDCVSCHAKDDAHQGSLGKDCSQCHTTASWQEGAKIDHSLTAFALTGKHQTVDCASCHKNNVFKGTPKDCRSCHTANDVHQGDLGSDCAKCHMTDDWKKATIDHSITAFPLLGKHLNVDCTTCHVNDIFKGTPKSCNGCHAKDDIHQGDLGTDCSKCHGPDDWTKATIDHSLTSFPLVGKHLSVDCASCHVNNVFKGAPTVCFSCHAKNDIHKGTLGTDCTLCHAATGWLPITFDHSQSAFPLTGRHQGLPCARCHITGPSGIVFKGTTTVCYGCHADPNYHAGLFGTNCSSCHNTNGWTPAIFNLAHSFDIHHGGASSCRDCHPNSLRASSCTKCHGPNGPDSGGGGGGG